MDLRVRNDLMLGSACASHANFGALPEILVINTERLARAPIRYTRGRVRSPELREYARDYSPALLRQLARAYSRLSLAIKLALISAGHTASHS